MGASKRKLFRGTVGPVFVRFPAPSSVNLPSVQGFVEDQYAEPSFAGRATLVTEGRLIVLTTDRDSVSMTPTDVLPAATRNRPSCVTPRSLPLVPPTVICAITTGCVGSVRSIASTTPLLVETNARF